MPEDIDWLILGDFNLIRRPENRNIQGGSLMEMFILMRQSVPWVSMKLLCRREYTWSNKQISPLLEKLDWAFTLNSWVLSYPDTSLSLPLI